MSELAEPPPPREPVQRCDVCARAVRESEFARFGRDIVCAQCKPVYVQRLREGVMPTRPRVRDLSGLTRWLKGFLIAGNVATFVGLITVSIELAKLLGGGWSRSGDSLTLGDVGVALFGLLQVGMAGVSGILLLRWIYCANANVRIMGATGLRFTPRGAILWYFIPLPNLWKPYQAMKEIWRASVDPENWRQVKVPKLLPLWWTLAIMSLFLSNAALWAEMQVGGFTGKVITNIVMIVSDLVDIPLNFVAIVLITQINDAQQPHCADDLEHGAKHLP